LRIFEVSDQVENLVDKLQNTRNMLPDRSKVLFDALVIILDVCKNKITQEFIQKKFLHLSHIITNLPYSQKPIRVGLSDARSLPLKNNQIDFVVTSPPYITHIPHPKLSQREITERKNQSEHKNKHKERKKAFEKQ